MAEVERVADRVGLIRDGQMARELSMAELRHQTTGRIRLGFAAAIDAAAFDGVPGVSHLRAEGDHVSVTMEGPVAALLSRAGELGAIDIETERRNLDDVFLELFDLQADAE